MTPDPAAVLLVSLLLMTLVFAALWRWFAQARKPRRLKYSSMRREEGHMGRYLRDYKPRTTVHSVVNRLYMGAEAVSVVRASLRREIFADVSFWQGLIDWRKMREKSRKVIIRAGQNLWRDIRFTYNWIEAGRVGMHRSVYFFYDGRVSPSAQLSTLKSALNGDIPLEIWVDWEHNYSGAHEGLRNVVAFMQAIEAEWGAGINVGLYTGFYWFTENSNPIWNAAQYKYLSTHSLWLAWYGGTPKIPAPWTAMRYHQFDTPAVGLEWGVETKEIDLNYDMNSDPDPTPLPDPEPDEEPMITYTGKVKETSTISPNVRSAPSGTIIGTLKPGQEFTVQGEIHETVAGYNWLNIVTPVLGWIAITTNIEYQAVEPTPTPPAGTYRLRLTGEWTVTAPDGKVYSKVVDIDTVMDAVE